MFEDIVNRGTKKIGVERVLAHLRAKEVNMILLSFLQLLVCSPSLEAASMMTKCDLRSGAHLLFGLLAIWHVTLLNLFCCCTQRSQFARTRRRSVIQNILISL